MEISHVIRAEEHLSNTARQIFIGESLGYRVAGVRASPGGGRTRVSKTKLSKRKLDKYLKNPDFARLYQHGLSDRRRTVGLETTPETFNPVVDRLLPRRSATCQTPWSTTCCSSAGRSTTRRSTSPGSR